MSKLVSIITPLYNSEAYIAKTIESVIAQIYQDWEMIIIDDFSTDKSYDIAASYALKEKRIHLIKLPQKSKYGAAEVRNAGIKVAQGAYIAFLDSDDVFLADKLTLQVEFMEKNRYFFTYGNYYVYEEKKKNVSKKYIAPAEITYKDLLRHCYIGCLTAMYDASELGKMYMPEDATKREDFALWLKILKRTNAYNVGKPLGIYRVSSKSVSSKKMEMAKHQYNVIRHLEKIGFFKSLFYMFCWSWLGFFKYKIRNFGKKKDVSDLNKLIS